MTKFEKHFSHPHVILPVIHVESPEQACYNAHLAVEAGADGVFIIINQGSDVSTTLTAGVEIRERFPALWLGVNLLDLIPQIVLSAVLRLEYPRGTFNGIWCDDAGLIRQGGLYDCRYASRVKKTFDDLLEDFIYFGGVEHKGGRSSNGEERLSARLATLFMDVVTTSGPGTGYAADLDKIKKMRAGAGSHPMAIASGITPANVSDYLPYIDAFLVATGVSVDDHNFDPVKLGALVRKVRQFDTEPRLEKSP